MYPLKIFVVFLHELSHGLAAIMTGGTILRIELTFDQGGVCVTRGGSDFVILSAGYLGSSLWGALLLVLSGRRGWNRAIVFFLGSLTLLITIVFVRSWFGLFYGLLAGGLIFAARRLQESFCELLVKGIGITSCLYAVYDIVSDVLGSNVRESDAQALAELTGIPSIIWGLLWTIIALLIAGVAFVVSGPRTSGAKAQVRL